VLADLRATLGLTAAPVLCRHVLWKRALPLLHPGYHRVEAAAAALEAAAPRLVLTGAHVAGVELAGTSLSLSLSLALSNCARAHGSARGGRGAGGYLPLPLPLPLPRPLELCFDGVGWS
jgi:hypothetical protein